MTAKPSARLARPEPDPRQLTASEPVPESPGPTALGARRRLRALAARSWTPGAIESQTGMPAALISHWTEGRGTISPDLADAITGVFNRLWDRDPPDATAEERRAAEKARARAVTGRWAPPLAWDDDKIDLPDGKPELGWRPTSRTTRRRADLMEDAEYVRENDGYRQASVAQVAMRLGVSRDCLLQAYVRTKRQAARSADSESPREAEAS